MSTETTMMTETNEELNDVLEENEGISVIEETSYLTETSEITLRSFIEMLESLPEEIKDLVFPIDFKDPSTPEERECIDTYNNLLATAQYEEAYLHRQLNPGLEAFIYDAAKMNYLQSLLLTVKSAEGIRYNDTVTKLGTTKDPVENVQDAIEAIKVLSQNLDKKINDNASNNTSLQNSLNKLPKHVYVTSLPASPASDTYYYLPEK